MGEADFTMGTDPEFFLEEKESGKKKSAIGIIEGTKDNPKPLPCGASIQKDNVALEFASKPAATEEDMVKNVQAAFMDILNEIPKDVNIVTEPSANFDEDQLDNEEAQMFGCDPDYNAWTVEMNEIPYCSDRTFRSCGGHIHLGFVENSGNDFLLDPFGKIDVVRGMDVIHGITSVVLDNSEKAIKRRELYGKAGCNRPTDYGVEYRVLSNFWLKSPELVMLMYRLSDEVLRLVRDKKMEGIIKDIGSSRIQSVINEGNVEEAISILDKNVKPVLSDSSLEMLDMCLANCQNYEFKKEWNLGGAE